MDALLHAASPCRLGAVRLRLLISICNVVTIEEQPYTQNLMILPVFDSRIPVTATHLMRMRLLLDGNDVTYRYE